MLSVEDALPGGAVLAYPAKDSSLPVGDISTLPVTQLIARRAGDALYEITCEGSAKCVDVVELYRLGLLPGVLIESHPPGCVRLAVSRTSTCRRAPPEE